MQPSSSSSFIQSYLPPICSLGLLATASSKFSHAPEFPNAKLGTAAFPTFCALFSAYRFYNCTIQSRRTCQRFFFSSYSMFPIAWRLLYSLCFSTGKWINVKMFLFFAAEMFYRFFTFPFFFIFNFIPFLVKQRGITITSENRTRGVCAFQDSKFFFAHASQSHF